jgi:hypothetical protein
MTPKLETTLDCALWYVSKGFSVIPLKTKDKKPAIEFWTPYQTQRATNEELEQWFGNDSKLNIGIVTGLISGIAVVDFDSPEAIEFSRKNDFPTTPLVKTGKGYHAYYRYKEGVRNFQKRDDLPGIDLRGDGGYVVAPPSIHESGKQYQWITGKGLDDIPLADLPEIVLAKRPEEKTPLKELYKGVPDGSRNDSLARVIGSLVNDGLSFDECLKFAYQWNERNNPPEIDLKKIERTVKSIYEKHYREKKKTEVKEGNDYKEIETPITDQNLIPVCSFPFDVFPKRLLEVIKNISDALHVEPELVANSMLTIISGALGNTIRISPKHNFEVAPFIWLIVIALSGYGKSPIVQTLLKHLKHLQAISYNEYQKKLQEYEKKFRKAKQDETVDIPEKPKLQHYVVSDCTVEALANVFECDGRGVIIYQDEIAGLILGFDQYKGKGNDRQHYLELFNCDSWKIDRKAGVKFIHNTGASIIGGIQPKVMPKVFREDSFDDGYLPRFLLYNAENRPLKFNRQAITDEVISYWIELLNWCYDIPLVCDDAGFIKPKVLILSVKALDLWEKFYNDYGGKMPFLSERARVFIPKLTAYYSLKFAGVLHAIEAFDKGISINSLIEDETIQRTIELTHYFGGQAIRALKLYEQPEDTLNEFQKRLIETLYKLQGEVKGGKLVLSRITEVFNSVLPQSVTPEKVSSMLRDLGLTTERSTGNYSYLLWESEKVQKLFSKTTLTTLTTVTKQKSDKGNKVKEVKEVNVDTENLIEVEGEI